MRRWMRMWLTPEGWRDPVEATMSEPTPEAVEALGEFLAYQHCEVVNRRRLGFRLCSCDHRSPILDDAQEYHVARAVLAFLAEHPEHQPIPRDVLKTLKCAVAWCQQDAIPRGAAERAWVWLEAREPREAQP